MWRRYQELSWTIAAAILVCMLVLVTTNVSADPLAAPASVTGKRTKFGLKPHSQMMMEKELSPVSASSIAAVSYTQAIGFYHTGDYNKAIDALELALAQDGNLRPARTLLVFLLLKTGAVSRAMVLLEKGYSEGVLDAQLTLLYARMLLEQQHSIEALKVLRGSSTLDSGKPAHLALLAGAHQKAGNYQDAALLYRRLFELQPHQGQWLTGQARALEAAGDRSGAAAVYAQAMASQIADPAIRAYSEQRLYALRSIKR